MPSLKSLIGMCFKDRSFKDQIIFWNHLNSYNDYFQRVRHVQIS